MNNLRLKRPLVFLDFETTGRAPATDRIVEIAAVRIEPDGTRTSFVRRVNPGIPIPADATRVHGIHDADVAQAPLFAKLAGELAQFIGDADLAGFNVARFDLPLLEIEMGRASVPFRREGRAILDAQVIFHRKEPRDLGAAHRFYCGEAFEGAHAALADVEASLRVLDAQLERYPDLPRDAVELHAWLNPPDPTRIDAEGKLIWAGGEAAINFGTAHRGKTLKRLSIESPDYLKWILAKDFSEEVKAVVRDALAGKYPVAPAPWPPPS